MDKFGRILIPKRIRDNLGLKAGAALEIELDGQGLVMKPVREEPRVLDKGGVLVFTGTAAGDIMGAVTSHREQRLRKAGSAKT